MGIVSFFSRLGTGDTDRWRITLCLCATCQLDLLSVSPVPNLGKTTLFPHSSHSAELRIHFYCLIRMRQAGHRKTIQSSALGLRHFKIGTKTLINPNWHEGWYLYLLVIFWSDFVSWFFIKTFQTVWRWKLTLIRLFWHVA